MAQRPFAVLQPFGQPGTPGNLDGLVLSNYTLPVKRITTATYTLVPEDSGWVLNFNTANGTAATVPVLPEGFNCLLYQKNSGNVTLNFAANVTNVSNVAGLTGPGSYTSLAVVDNQYGTSAEVLLSSVSSSQPVDSPPQAPVNITPPSISGTATQGFTLVANPGTWSNNPTSFSYQWTANGSNIANATASTFVPGSAEVNAIIRVVVTASNAGGPTPVASGSVGPVGASATAPTNTSLPLITGTPTEGQLLSVSNGTWTNSPTSYTYQWNRSATPITGATGATYLLATADVASTITCTVTAFNGSNTGSATSAATATIAAASGGTGYTAEASTLFSSMTSQPNTARKALIDALITSLKTGATSGTNLWAKLDVLQVYAAHDSQASTLNWVNPGTLTASTVNGPTWTTDRGYAGNGSSSYVNTSFNPSVNGAQFTQNSLTVSVWSRTSSSIGSNVAAGNLTHFGTSGVIIRTRDATDNFAYRASDGTTTTTANADGSGLFTAMRTSSTAKKAYRNGTQLGTTTTLASATLTNAAMFVGAFNDTTDGAGSYSTAEIALFTAGSSRSDAEELDFYNAIRTFFVAIGAAT